MHSHREYEDFLRDFAVVAGEVMRANWSPNGSSFEYKADGTEVTKVDLAISRMFGDAFMGEYPQGIILDEEGGYPPRGDASVIAVCDPLDGTRRYKNGGREAAFAAAIMLRPSLVEADVVPVVSVINAPLFEGPGLFTAIEGVGSYLNGVQLYTSNNNDPLVVDVATAGIDSELYDATGLIGALKRQGYEVVDVGSASYSCARLASRLTQGVFYPWTAPHDTVMGDLLVRMAGGATSDLKGKQLRYEEDTVHGFVMANNYDTHDMLLKVAAQHLRE